MTFKLKRWLKLNKFNNGYTLIELLVVITIIGILSAIALPSFLNQASKARETEAIQNLKLVLDKQQTYYYENDSKFATTWEELWAGLPEQSLQYNYTLFGSEQITGIIINSESEDLRSYIGGIKVTPIRGQSTFLTARCQSIKRGDILKPESFLVGKNQVLCGKRVEPIK